MYVYQLTKTDRDLLLAGADLEAVLADRERERLEREDRAETRPDAEKMVRFGDIVPRAGEERYEPPGAVAA
jgi:hypothetical protein